LRQLDDAIDLTLAALCARVSGPIGVAVSGGGDSLALLYLTADWARRTGRSLLGLTVDHGLRPEAAEEAQNVARHCAALDIPHQTLKWTPPERPIGQARSRRARHQLLAGAMSDAAGEMILMGHNRNDQEETVIMRAARAQPDDLAHEGLAGIRALAVSPVWPEGRGVFIGRPCLHMSRATLRDVLRSRGLSWSEDPSNLNHAYERVRVRASISERGDEGLDMVGFLKTLRDAQGQRAIRDRVLARWLCEDVTAENDGTIRFDAENLGKDAGMDAETLATGLAWLLMAAAGSDRRARLEGRLKLARDILATPQTFRARTLGGAWIAPRQKRVTLARDPGRVPRQSGCMTSGSVWDGRFLLQTRDVAVTSNMASNLHIRGELDAPSAMARDSFPPLEGSDLEAVCLVPDRLKQVASMLDYDNLTLESIKKT